MIDDLTDFPHDDADWTTEQWRTLLESLVDAGILTWGQITSLVLGHLNPSQVGTSIATKKSFQRHYPRRKCWAAVRKWHFEQEGRCEDCGTRLELQADHIIPKEIIISAGRVVAEDHEAGSFTRAELTARCRHAMENKLGPQEQTAVSEDLLDIIAADLAECIDKGDPSDHDMKAVADRLENVILRCRRCNVVRRPSHAKGGITHQAAESALMWILLTRRPRTYREFLKLCRTYGLTMANIRMEEAWAMARWLAREGKYDIDSESKYAP